ncbi:hypothetical protein SDC9_140685 [bioreactor metagenome]|uniref:Uncharacterized protein n=1 Tax=bioreactor metagenome TaxID=1076179 RepID=A0A645DW37_9ZZZZ
MAPSGAVGGLFSGGPVFRTGPLRAGEREHRRRTDGVPERLFFPEVTAGADRENGGFRAGGLFPVSAAGVPAGLCFSGRGVASGGHCGIRLLPFVFRLLLHGGLWPQRRSFGAGGVRAEVPDHAAVLLCRGGSGAGKVRGAGCAVAGKEWAARSALLWPGVVAPVRNSLRGAGRRGGDGTAGVPEASQLGPGADLSVT